jgi:SAM-dependent methyltransferase
MQWRAKALVQSCVAQLPERATYPLYFAMQRYVGSLRRNHIDPTSRLRFGMEFCRQIVEHGRSPQGAEFLEVGTGWRLNLPIACWLCGASRIATLDLNPYLRFSLIKEDLRFLQQQEASILSKLRSDYGDLVDESRWRRLLSHSPTNVESLSDLCGIEYHSPADARRTGFTPASFDFQVSCNVFEHIPPGDLRAILREANRILRPNGLLLHRVDHTDHFSHSDRALPAIHFLQFNDTEWSRYAGNRFAYVNRLREDDYVGLFTECGQKVCAVDSEPDVGTEQILREGFSLDERFREKPIDTLSRLTSMFVVAPSSSSQAAGQAA